MKKINPLMIVVIWCCLMFTSVFFLDADIFFIFWFIANFAAFTATIAVRTLRWTKPDGYLFLFESGKTPVLRIDNELPHIGGELIIYVEDGDHADIPEEFIGEEKDVI